MNVSRLLEFKIYQGVHISALAFLDKTKIPINIDIGFADILTPKAQDLLFPTLLKMKAPIVQTYTIELVIAEKFQAIVSLGKMNSRLKDFYDVYLLQKSFDFNGYILLNTIKMVFNHRKTDFDVIRAFEQSFTENELRLRQWSNFMKKKHIIVEVDFPLVMSEIKTFLNPIVLSILMENEFHKNWNHLNHKWE
jgi:hypothetical protein